ncbi:MAG: alpha/beta fold hydrolase [Cyanobacteria bacterium J06638_22]
MSSRNPVLLVHGIDDTTILFDTLSGYLEEQGWETYSLDLHPNNGDAGLEVLAEQVDTFAEKTLGRDRSFDLLGFSMGGIVSRYYLQRLGGIRQVQRFITIASPHHGTWMAYARWNEGGEQMRPDSPFLKALNADIVATLGQINVTSIWTPLDAMIVPASSSQIPVGRNVSIHVAAHPWMVTDTRVLKAVAIALSEPLISPSGTLSAKDTTESDPIPSST